MNAVLIMGHKNLNQIRRLVEKCVSTDTIVIVHLDCEMDISEQEIHEIIAVGGILTDKRIHGELDTRSLVDIAMLMVDKAKHIEDESGKHIEYFLLLSGQDYLTKPIHVINRNLSQNYPKPYIDCTPYDRNNWIYHKFNQSVALRGFNRFVTRRFPKKSLLYPIRVLGRIIGLIWEKTLRILRISEYDHLRKMNVELYGGSAWWILPDIAMDYIVEEYEKEYSQVLLSTNTPEETYFQTMAMRSPIHKYISVNPVDMIAQNCKTWAYFSDEGKPFKGHPYIFTENEFEKLINCDCWIARKFDETEDKVVLNLLDHYLDMYEG